MQFTACQRRFQHIAGVHRAFALTSADHGVQLIDKQNDAAFGFAHIFQNGFQTFFKLTAVFGTGQQRAHIQRQNTFVFQVFRYFAVNDALRQTFDHGGFTHARRAYKNRIIFGAALQYLNGAADFVVTANHRVEFAGFGPLG